MTHIPHNEELLIQLFYKHLDEIERGLTNLRYKLKDNYQDALQDALLSILTYNKRNSINLDNIKNFYFITIKNRLLEAIKVKQRNTNRYESLDDTEIINDVSVDIIPIESNLSDDDEQLKSSMLNYITKDEYQELLDYYTARDNGEDILGKTNTRVAVIKRKLLMVKKYTLILPNGEKSSHKSLKSVIDIIGCSQAYQSKRTINNKLSFKGETYTIIEYKNIGGNLTEMN